MVSGSYWIYSSVTPGEVRLMHCDVNAIDGECRDASVRCRNSCRVMPGGGSYFISWRFVYSSTSFLRIFTFNWVHGHNNF